MNSPLSCLPASLFLHLSLMLSLSGVKDYKSTETPQESDFICVYVSVFVCVSILHTLDIVNIYIVCVCVDYIECVCVCVEVCGGEGEGGSSCSYGNCGGKGRNVSSCSD